MKKIVLVTQNKNKVEDFQKLMSEYVVEHVDFDIPEMQSFSPREIVENKLKFAFDKINIPCVVHDSSLFINSLNGFPGPFIKFFYHIVGNRKITEICNLYEDKSCRWVSIMAVYDGENVQFIEESVEGKISDIPKGTHGYAWDPIFIPDGETRTLAEMTFEEKQKYAVTQKLVKKLEQII